MKKRKVKRAPHLELARQKARAYRPESTVRQMEKELVAELAASWNAPALKLWCAVDLFIAVYASRRPNGGIDGIWDSVTEESAALIGAAYGVTVGHILLGFDAVAECLDALQRIGRIPKELSIGRSRPVP